jgi:O-antigen ligase
MGNDPHNSYLQIVAEGGILAALFLVGALVATGMVLLRAAAPGPVLGPAGALVSLLVSAVFGGELWRLPFWFFLGIVAAGVRASRSVPQ